MFLKAVARLALGGVALSLAATAASAEVIEKDADHFVLRYSVGLETTPEDIYGAIAEVGQWWNPAHTYSGDSANLTLPLNVGACFCEALKDGTNFEHGIVVEADPDLGVLLAAPLGPLKGKTTRADWSISWSDGNRGYELIMTYVVRGPGVGAFAEPVDGVMHDQFGRLAHFIEYGPAAPDAEPAH
jgi:hypothetical protein